MTPKPKSETLWMAHGEGGFVPWLWGDSRQSCRDRIGDGPNSVKPVRVTITPAKPRERAKK